MAGFTAADAARWVERAIERPRRRGDRQHRPSVETSVLKRYAASTRSRSNSASSIAGVELVPGRSGTATSRATIAAGCRLRCGRCSASGCCTKAPSAAALASDARASPSGLRRAPSACLGAAAVFASSRAGRLRGLRRFVARGLRRRRGGCRCLARPALIAQRQRALDDRLEQSRRSRRPCAGRFDRQMSGIVLRQDVGEVALALHAERRELGDVDGARPVVAVLDEQPRSPPSLLRRAPSQPLVRTSTHDPFSL